ncbi:MAG: transporter [Verrucomicrobia bacterium RIFCSPHIGHO2_12_FULL_41_10]|nr:MAG: transporter [Verrucomicrobia bacterium RIFCSPHIGHO2_12_FULL_41_10]
MKENDPKHLSQLALILLIVGAIDSIRNLPLTALFGSTLIFFFIFSAIVFLIPVALVSAQLSSSSREHGGIYHWVCLAFGPKIGLLAIWLQWINTLVWFPTILSFIAGTVAYFFDPQLAANKAYLVSVVLIVFWFMTFISLSGLHTTVKFASICSIIGIVTPMVLIIGLAIAWIILGEPLQVQFSLQGLLPNLARSENWVSLTAIMTSFLGIELATVHISEVKDPERIFPKALFISVAVILLTMIMGSLSIALVLPRDKISLVGGVMQAFTNFFMVYHMSFLIPVVTAMIIIGALGGMISWIISPAKGILQAAQSGYFPSFFAVQNRHGVAARLLLTQAVIVTLVCFAFEFMPSVNGSYWLLSDLSTQLYILMYVLMFLAALVLKGRNLNPSKHAFRIPGGKLGTQLICALGLSGCAITLIVGFIPPSNIDVGGGKHYLLIFCSGIVLMVSPILFFIALRKSKDKRSDPAL